MRKVQHLRIAQEREEGIRPAFRILQTIQLARCCWLQMQSCCQANSKSGSWGEPDFPRFSILAADVFFFFFFFPKVSGFGWLDLFVSLFFFFLKIFFFGLYAFSCMNLISCVTICCFTSALISCVPNHLLKKHPWWLLLRPPSFMSRAMTSKASSIQPTRRREKPNRLRHRIFETFFRWKRSS